MRESSSGLAIHGGRAGDARYKIDGLSIQNPSGDGGGANKIFTPNPIAMSETTTASAEM